MLLATALATFYYRMCSTDVYCSKQTGNRSVASKETITHHFFVSGIGQKKTVDALQNLAAQKMLLKQKPANIRKWIARFFYCFRHLYSTGSSCVMPTIIAWVAHRYGQLYLHCSLIYFWVPSSCFCIVISLSLRVEIIPIQRYPRIGGRLHYPRRRR